MAERHLEKFMKITKKMKKVDFPLLESESTLDDYKKALSDFTSQGKSFIHYLDVVFRELKVMQKIILQKLQWKIFACRVTLLARTT